MVGYYSGPTMKKEAIGQVIDAIHQGFPEASVVVIDDGSTDKTRQVSLGRGCHVLYLPHNVGIGTAVQTGYMYAKEKGYKVVVRVDADGQHNSDEITKLLGPLARQEADVVIGSRYLLGQRPTSSFPRRIGGILLSWLLSAIVRQRITDPTSGFQAIGERAVEVFSDCYPDDYPEPEAIKLARRKRLIVKEVTVRASIRSGGKSSITAIRAFYYMFKVLLSIFVDVFRTE